jgi:sulfate/thiosulfate transport system substrate-binding protein
MNARHRRGIDTDRLWRRLWHRFWISAIGGMACPRHGERISTCAFLRSRPFDRRLAFAAFAALEGNAMRFRAALLALSVLTAPVVQAQTDILNASYDVGRELYAEINTAFVPYWKAKTGQDATVRQSHAGSSRQALAIREGLQADVVTFNQVSDVQVLADNKLVAADWTRRLPHASSPFYSVHSILVRKGNPKGIRGWDDLAKPGVKVVQVNPKTGGNGRYAVLSYYAHALETQGGDAAKARDFTRRVLANVAVFESGGRAATTAFTDRGIGDALVTFESEALALAAAPNSAYEVVTPAVSVLSEFPVALVDRVADARRTRALAQGYLEFLYTPQAQEIVARHFYRPRDAEVARRAAERLPPVKALEVDAVFGGWPKVSQEFFANNALVDTLLREIATAR